VTGDLFIQCAQYIAGVSSVLKRTYGLGAQQQVAVKNAIVAAFTSANIPTMGSTPYTDDLRFPDFSNVGDSLQRDNPSAYNRLDPLFTLGLFRNEFRGRSFHALVSRAAVLDLSQIPSDEIKNALAQLVVLSAHAYYNTQTHSGTIRQFLVFDEGHRVLASEFMLRLVRECRAYGVGTILSSQYPSDFPGEISASMETKILHGNGRDVEKVKVIVQMIGCEGREGDAANLERFQAFVNNRHYPHTLLRTMNYPVYLVWDKLRQLGTSTREDLSRIEGIDTSKLPIGNLIRQLELLGLAQEKEGRVSLLR
jgi:DNA phosphorothioation-dependent restriction protein DptH